MTPHSRRRQALAIRSTSASPCLARVLRIAEPPRRPLLGVADQAALLPFRTWIWELRTRPALRVVLEPWRRYSVTTSSWQMDREGPGQLQVELVVVGGNPAPR